MTEETAETTAEWRDGESGRLPLTLRLDDVLSIPKSGSADAFIADLRTIDRIERQLQAMPADEVRRVLAGYGAWDDEKLSDHNDNLDRLLWIAAGDLRGPDYMCPDCEEFYVLDSTWHGDYGPFCPNCATMRKD